MMWARSSGRATRRRSGRAIKGMPGRSGDRTLDAQTIACVISGGKIDNDTLATILRGEIPIKEH